jgi:hypothetical protein
MNTMMMTKAKMKRRMGMSGLRIPAKPSRWKRATMTSPSVTLYREIRLTRDQVAKVSPRVFEKYNAHKWCAYWSPITKSYYAVRRVKIAFRKYVLVWLHREILGLSYGDPMTGDHKNHDTLDNTDENLRLANLNQQRHNQRKRSDNTSGFKGVDFHKRTGKWRASIYANGRAKHLGLFASPQEAYAAYCEAARFYFGEFACMG